MKPTNSNLPATLTLSLIAATSVTFPTQAQVKPFSAPGTAVPVPPVPPPAPTLASPPPASPSANPAPVPQLKPEPGSLNSFFNGALPEALGKSRINVDARLRYEFADQGPVGTGPDPKVAHAFTLRTRVGLTTPSLHGFQAMVEGENVSVLGPEHNFNAAGSNGQGDRSVVADPPTTELNQAWLSYSHWDTTVRGGRQRIALDNHRFIGDIAWRQNMQTFDAVSVENHSVQDLSLYYAYLWDVRRIYGDVSGLPAANRDFESDSHLLHAEFTRWKFGRIGAYAYLLDLQNDAPTTPNNSTATYGGFLAGATPLSEAVQLGYRAEFAWQTDYGNSPLDYQAEYYNFELGLNARPFAAGVGYEVLGTDNRQGFRTPLSTLHAFNGWSDLFLATPLEGLQDTYAYIQYSPLPDLPIRLVFHQFHSDRSRDNFGQEYGILVTKKLGKHWFALAKYAHHAADDGPYPDSDRLWLEVTFSY